ncbi:alpha/beta fold hydrolase [Frigidibacter albus]|uniref:Alpha/beta fold hydrolase n=1 Tax=Frigidibacter albus TaxID=1465486 RepID=A0A6L8VI26_9RHOB|nr:alpha/beta hydrolase [Frigidibacter albus]MZQ89182.1 alpha/beta fold hydrolase [Frigidibacter albus]NBE30761.1 alpha/beta fold hydrolase [Frigidibacter albus]GGH50909.1 alpha/beta hydrolase [Frigidibacter albus]
MSEERYVTLNGCTFRYRIAGEEHPETIILLHGGRGIGDHLGEWRAYSALSDRYRVIAYDQRGCGLSSITHPMSFRQYAEDVEAFRRHFCGEEGKFILQGGSFGGMIALTYAVLYPQHLSRLMVRGTAPSHHHEAEAIAIFKSRIDRVPSASPAMIDKLFSENIIDDTELRLIWLALQPLYYEAFDPDAALERTRTMHLHAETHNAMFREKEHDLREALRAVGVPTLVFCGEKDWICPPSQSRLIAELMPQAELWEVPGANHSCHIEKNAEVLAHMRAFLQRTAS